MTSGPVRSKHSRRDTQEGGTTIGRAASKSERSRYSGRRRYEHRSDAVKVRSDRDIASLLWDANLCLKISGFAHGSSAARQRCHTQQPAVGQIALQPNQASFTSALAMTWRAVARRSHMGAKLVIRFGAIPSTKTDPEKMILASLLESAAGWAVRDVSPVQPPAKQNRQASQFGRAGAAVSEVDITAELIARGRS